MQKYYKAEMDKLLRVSTRVIWLFFILFPFILAFTWFRVTSSPSACPFPFGNSVLGLGLALLASLTALTALVTRSMAPKGYALSDAELLIDRKIKPVRIPLREITEVRALEDGLFRGSLRLMGTSGFYGHYGLFWNRKLGKFRAYVTRTKDLVAVRTEKGLFLLSPDDTKDFTISLNALLRK